MKSNLVFLSALTLFNANVPGVSGLDTSDCDTVLQLWKTMSQTNTFTNGCQVPMINVVTNSTAQIVTAL